MSKEFSEKVVLITGVCSGIGADTAVHFSNLGASLALTDRNLEHLEKLADKCARGKTLLIHADVTNENDQAKIIAYTIEKYGKLDVLVNNAVIFEMGALEKVDLPQLDKILDTNVRAAFQITKLAIPYLKSSRGSIVNVSSVAGLRPAPGCISYCMSKSAMDQFSQCLALELASDKVRVNSVNRAITEADILKYDMKPEVAAVFLQKENEKHPLGRVGQAEDVANAIAFLASDKASFITGVLLPVDGGLSIACPL